MASSNLSEMFGILKSSELPSNPLMAVTLAMAFKTLGGDFSISSRGVRYMGRAMPYMYGKGGEPLPQLPSAAPHETFHSSDEWNGAMKVLDILLRGCPQEDMDVVYGIFAQTAVDERSFVPSIEEPLRRAA